MKIFITAALYLFIGIGLSSAQKKIFPFTFQGNNVSFDYSPVQIPLDGINFNSDSLTIGVFRIEGKQKTEVPSQIEWGYANRIWFIPGIKVLPGKKVNFQLEIIPKLKLKNDPVTVLNDNQYITLKSGNKNILSYRSAIQEAPEGTDILYRRSGFIHPLWSPEGKVLTRIQPTDHFHHYGIWNPWTKVKIRDKEVDFWNLASGQGTVRFAGLLSTQSGNVFCGLRVKHEHIDFTSKGPDKLTINETWDVRAFPIKIENKTVWLVDFVSILCNAIDTTLVLEQYRYGGGIGFRATEMWNTANSSVLTSEGKNRDEADGSFARWCNISGKTGINQKSGITFFSHPLNQNHPESMRVWPSNQYNGKSNVFFEFCPIRHKSIDLEPNKELVFRYRILVYDGEFSKEALEQVWQNYAYPLKVVWQ